MKSMQMIMSQTLKSRISPIANTEIPLMVKVDEVACVTDGIRHLLKEIDKDYKTLFSNWIIQQEVECFEPFRKTLEELLIALA